MSKNIRNERWENNVSNILTLVPAGGGNVPVVVVSGERFMTSTVYINGRGGRFQPMDTVFIKRVRFYSPWIPFGAQIIFDTIPDSLHQLEFVLSKSGSETDMGRPVCVNTLVTLGEWVDVNAIVPLPDPAQNPGADTLYLIGRLFVNYSMQFPASIPSAIVGKGVKLVLEAELAHTLEALGPL